MRPVTSKMIEVLMECHEREILGQKTRSATIPYATGLISRQLVNTRYFTNNRGKRYLAINITETGKRFLEEYTT